MLACLLWPNSDPNQDQIESKLKPKQLQSHTKSNPNLCPFSNTEALLGVLGSREHRGKNDREQGAHEGTKTRNREMMKWNLGVI